MSHLIPPLVTPTGPAAAAGLRRRLGTYSAMMVVLAAMIGSGVFKKVAVMSAELGSAGWVLAAWAVAGLVTLCGALTNAEVACLITDPGGQYKYFERMYGRFFAFLYGWASFAVIQSATAASVAYVFAQSINSFVPLPRLSPELEAVSLLGFFTPLENLGVKGLTILLLILLSLVNARGVHWGSMVSNVLSSTVVVAIVLIIALCFVYGGGVGLADAQHFTPANATTPGLGAITLTGFFTAMMSAFWAYEGWNSLGFLGGEVRRPERTIPRALVAGVGLVMTLYLMVNTAYLYVLPVGALAALAERTNAIAAVEVVSTFMGAAGAALILGLIATATFSSTNNTLMAASRVYYAMACDRLFFKAAGRTNANGVPAGSLIIQAAWGSMLVLSGSFDQLTDMLVFAAFLFYGAGAAGVFVLRRRYPDAPRSFRVPLYPVLPAAFALFCAVLVSVTVIERPREAVIGACLIAAGIPFYLAWSGVAGREGVRES